MIRFLISDRTGTHVSRFPSWSTALGLVVAAAMGAALLVVGLGVALLLAPVVIVGGLVIRHRIRKAVAQMNAQMEAMRQQAQGPGYVIDVDYKVVDEERSQR
jgi:hypothetical protein